VFFTSSHGLRPGKNCHSAIKYFDQQFKPATWLIDTLTNVSTALRETYATARSKMRRPAIHKIDQKSAFSILSLNPSVTVLLQREVLLVQCWSIYFWTSLFAAQLKTQFDKGNRARNTQAFNRSRHLIRKAALFTPQGVTQGVTQGVFTPQGVKKDKLALKQLSVQSRKIDTMDFYDPNFKRLSYVRYADHFLVGIRGSYADALNTLAEVKRFCSTINFTLNAQKTKITNLNKQKAVFLGVNVFRSQHTKVTLRKKPFFEGGWYKQRNNKQIQYHVSLDLILIWQTPVCLKMVNPTQNLYGWGWSTSR
jgi:hypothetical protein